MNSQMIDEQTKLMLVKACDITTNQLQGYLEIRDIMQKYRLTSESIQRCEKLERIYLESGISIYKNPEHPAQMQTPPKEPESKKDKRIWITTRNEFMRHYRKGRIPCKYKTGCTRLDCKGIHFKDQYICRHKLDENEHCPVSSCMKIVLKRCLSKEACNGKFCTYRHESSSTTYN